MSTPAEFLRKLRPGHWTLTAIHPDKKGDGAVVTVYAEDAEAVEAFVAKYEGKHNIYFQPNPTKSTVAGRNKRASKAHITQAEWVHADADPRDDEKPEQAKKRYRAALAKWKPKDTFLLDSGNGIQVGWRLKKPLPPERFEEVEAAAKAAMEALGAVAGTQDVSRLLRLPGTTNLPNAKKRKAGRAACQSKLLSFGGATCKLDDFPKPVEKATLPATTTKLDWAKVEAYGEWLTSPDDLPKSVDDKARTIVASDGDLEALKKAFGKPEWTWSHVAHSLAARLKPHMPPEKVVAALLCDLPCNQHVLQQNDARRAAKRAVARSFNPNEAWRINPRTDAIVPSMHNARVAIEKLGIECSHDTFHGKILFGYAGDDVRHAVGDEVSDAGIVALRGLISNRFGFDPGADHTRSAVMWIANENKFDPVCDMLEKAQGEWDKVERLDAMAVTHFNAADTPLNRVYVRKWMIAAVRRARHPGCKFDNILVLESLEGWFKSAAFAVLAGDRNFSDASILGEREKEVQEQLAGVWIHENGEMHGMKRAEVEKVKLFARRQVDRARPAYGHYRVDQDRHSVECGTTNNFTYLLAMTGNRCFWPLRVTAPLDIELMRRDRLQLWGEAATYEAAGEDIQLPEEFWVASGVVQEQRRLQDPWELLVEAMRPYSEDDEKGVVHSDMGGERETVATADVLRIVLGKEPAQQTRQDTMRLAEVMQKLGWQRPDGKLSINKRQQRGYVRWRKTKRARQLQDLLG